MTFSITLRRNKEGDWTYLGEPVYIGVYLGEIATTLRIDQNLMTGGRGFDYSAQPFTHDIELARCNYSEMEALEAALPLDRWFEEAAQRREANVAVRARLAC